MKKYHSGFTLVGLVVSLAIMAVCSVIASFYYQEIIKDQEITRAKVKLHEVRSAYLIWQSRNPNSELTDINKLDTLAGGDQARLDPWGNPMILDIDQRLIISTGPDGTLDGSGNSTGTDDDISEPLPPAPVATAIDSDQYVQKQQLPVIVSVYPTGAVLTNSPKIGATYKAISAKIDKSSIWFTIDNENMSSDASISQTNIEWKSKTPLTTGPHNVLLKIQDLNGNVCVRPWTFFIKQISG